MRIRVENILGVDRAEIEASPVALLCGPNGAGKSSVADAVSAVLTSEPKIRGVRTVKALTHVVHANRERGSVTVETDAGKAILNYPSGMVVSEGEKPPHLSKLAAGLLKPFAIRSDKERSEAISEALDATPTEDDLEVFLNAHKDFPVMAVDKIMEKVGKFGWDGALKDYVDANRVRKSQFRDLTGMTWGKNAIDAYEPDGWSDELRDHDLESLKSERDIINSKLDELLNNRSILAAASEMETKAAQEFVAEWEDGGAERLAQCEKDIADSEADLARIEEPQLRASPQRQDNLPCPECGKPISVHIEPSSALISLHRVESPEQYEETLRRHEVRLDDYREQKQDLIKDIGALSREIHELKNLRSKANDGASLLARLKAAEGQDEDSIAASIAESTEALNEAEKRCAALGMWQKASKLDASIKRVAKLISIMEPSGLPKTILAESLDEMNKNFLTPAGEAIGLSHGPVLDENLSVMVCNRPYELASAGERQAADFALQLSAAKRNGEPMVVLDGADLLVEPYRSGLVKLLLKMNMTAIVCLAEDSPEMVEPLVPKRTDNDGDDWTCPVNLYWLEKSWASQVGVVENA